MSSIPHIIRLRGPWSLFLLESSGSCYRWQWPIDDGLMQPWAATETRVTLTRGFNRPTGLETGKRVWLVIEAPAADLHVQLNRHELVSATDSAPDFRCDITMRLEGRNEIRLEFATHAEALPAREVRLEIEG